MNAAPTSNATSPPASSGFGVMAAPYLRRRNHFAPRQTAMPSTL